MEDNYLSFLFSPLSLLFLITAFFLIFMTSFTWNRFFTMNCTQNAIKATQLCEFPLYFIKVLLLFLPFILIKSSWNAYALIATLQDKFDFAPLLTSPFRYYLGAMLLALVGLIILKKVDKKSTRKGTGVFCFIFSYLFMLYIIYFIVIVGTVVTGLNALPDHMDSPMQPFLALFLGHLLLISLIISLEVRWKILVLVIYTTSLVFACYLKSIDQHYTGKTQNSPQNLPLQRMD